MRTRPEWGCGLLPRRSPRRSSRPVSPPMVARLSRSSCQVPGCARSESPKCRREPRPAGCARGGETALWPRLHQGRILVYSSAMALNIKNEEVEQLAAEVARITGESKTEAIRRALAERRQRLSYRVHPSDRQARALRFLEREVWPRIPADQIGRRLSRNEEDEILGYGPQGI